MKAVILAGGKGTRLNLTDLPKPLAPILGKPILEHIINFLKFYGIKDVILCTSYMSEKIKDYFENGEKFGVKITYIIEKEPLGTGGALKNIMHLLDETFIFINGDCLMDINVDKLLDFHKLNNAAVSVVLTECTNDGQDLVLLKENEIVKFLPRGTEDYKILLKSENKKLINAGIYIFEPSIFKKMPENKFFLLEKDWFPFLFEDKQKFFGYYRSTCYFEIGNPELYLKTQQREDVIEFLRRLNE